MATLIRILLLIVAVMRFPVIIMMSGVRRVLIVQPERKHIANGDGK